MPIRCTVQPGIRRVHCVIEGDFSTEEITATILGIVEHPEFRPGFEILSDHSRIGEPINRAQVGEMVSLLGSHREKIKDARLAVVVAKPASLGMMNMLAVLAGDLFREVQVFRTVEQAEQWLRDSRQENRDDRSGARPA